MDFSNIFWNELIYYKIEKITNNKVYIISKYKICKI
jgi:hypothetical protein